MSLSLFIEGLLPEWILLLGGCAVLLFGWGHGPTAGRWAGPLAVFVILLALAGTAVAGTPTDLQLPGILLTPLLHYVRLGGLSVGLLILLCNLHLPAAEERGEFFAMILFSLLGLLLTAAANHLIVLFLAIELVSVPTYILVALSREDARASEAAVKYFFLGALAAALMLYGFSFLYGGLAGSMTLQAVPGQAAMSTVAAGLPATEPYVLIGLLLAFAGLFFKMAAVPFHVYAPDVYEGAAAPVTGLLGFLPKFAGFVAAIKLLAVFEWQVAPAVLWLIWVVAALTMTVGNVLALLQSNVKRMLAYSSIAHSGYMLVGLLVGPALGAAAVMQGPLRDGVTAVLFYMVVYGVTNLGAFAVLAALRRADGTAAEDVGDLAGLSTRHPGLALALAVCCFGLMGFPPTAGLLGKVYLFSSAFALGEAHPFGGPLVILAIIGVINSAIGAVYYLRIIAACYLRPGQVATQRTGGVALGASVALCALLVLALFVRPAAVTRPAGQAASALLPVPADSAATRAATLPTDRRQAPW